MLEQSSLSPRRDRNEPPEIKRVRVFTSGSTPIGESIPTAVTSIPMQTGTGLAEEGPNTLKNEMRSVWLPAATSSPDMACSVSAPLRGHSSPDLALWTRRVEMQWCTPRPGPRLTHAMYFY